VHRVQKFVEVSSGRIGYARTAAALSEVSNYYSALLVREGDGVKIFEETVNVAAP
jgi:hypothetical protein